MRKLQIVQIPSPQNGLKEQRLEMVMKRESQPVRLGYREVPKCSTPVERPSRYIYSRPKSFQRVSYPL